LLTYIYTFQIQIIEDNEGKIEVVTGYKNDFGEMNEILKNCNVNCFNITMELVEDDRNIVLNVYLNEKQQQPSLIMNK
jgi:hypothetical protein